VALAFYIKKYLSYGKRRIIETQIFQHGETLCTQSQLFFIKIIKIKIQDNYFKILFLKKPMKGGKDKFRLASNSLKCVTIGCGISCHFCLV
jgi:hypothetical protein